MYFSRSVNQENQVCITKNKKFLVLLFSIIFVFLLLESASAYCCYTAVPDKNNNFCALDDSGALEVSAETGTTQSPSKQNGVWIGSGITWTGTPNNCRFSTYHWRRKKICEIDTGGTKLIAEAKVPKTNINFSYCQGYYDMCWENTCPPVKEIVEESGLDYNYDGAVCRIYVPGNIIGSQANCVARWDASNDACVVCKNEVSFGAPPIKVAFCGGSNGLFINSQDDSGYCIYPGYSGHVVGATCNGLLGDKYGTCESACGADPYCDELSPGSYAVIPETSEPVCMGNFRQKCTSMCQLDPSLRCSSACGDIDSLCQDKIVGQSCGNGKICFSNCQCLDGHSYFVYELEPGQTGISLALSEAVGASYIRDTRSLCNDIPDLYLVYDDDGQVTMCDSVTSPGFFLSKDKGYVFDVRGHTKKSFVLWGEVTSDINFRYKLRPGWNIIGWKYEDTAIQNLINALPYEEQDKIKYVGDIYPTCPPGERGALHIGL